MVEQGYYKYGKGENYNEAYRVGLELKESEWIHFFPHTYLKILKYKYIEG